MFPSFDLGLAVHAQTMDQKISDLEKVSGMTIDQITNLFAKGYTLKEPDSNDTFSNIMEALGKV